MRQVVIDTETTGLEPSEGHRVIEIGAVELIDRRVSGQHFQQYLNPERDIEDGALEVHGISREFLADKPRFCDIVDDFLAFIGADELVIHNADFDLAFLDMEMAALDPPVGPWTSIRRANQLSSTAREVSIWSFGNGSDL
jgi:DNA polymerase-3 subunit epsilon